MVGDRRARAIFRVILMARAHLKSSASWLLLLGFVGIASGLGGLAMARQLEPRLPTYGELPEFSLTDQARQPVTRRTLLGSVWIADFIFTRCAGQCPLMSDEMAGLRTAFRRHPALHLVSFSVDPAHDTPEVLSAYAARYTAERTRWRFVTGEEQVLVDLARHGFRLGVDAHGTQTEPITHSTRFILIDRHARIRGYYDATDRAAIERLRRDAARLLRT